MNIAEALKTLKEFFLEFLGYFLPGFFLLFLLSITVNKSLYSYSTQSTLIILYDYNILFIFISYALGYVIYGLDLLLDLDNFFNVKSKLAIQENIKKSLEYSAAKELIDNKISKENTDLNFSSYRNFAMSIIGEKNVNTIYTFIFRADLCRHLSLNCLLIGYLGSLWSTFSYLLPNQIVNNSIGFLFFYIILIIFAFPLRKTSERFELIGLKIAFSMFLAIQYYDNET